MKPAIICLALPVIMAVAACKKSVPLREGALPLTQCRTQLFENDEVKICYDSLVNDSRCPVGGQCIWEGMAVAKFSFYTKNTKHLLTLATIDFKIYNRDTIVGDYKIELLNIDPYPGVHAPPPASASIKITKI